MWENLKNTVEEHPLATGVVVFAVGIVVILWFRRGSGGNTVVDNTGLYNAQAAAIASGNALQGLQYQLQSQNANLQTQFAAKQDQNATNLAIAKLSADMQTTLGLAQITETGHEADLAAQTSQAISTLNATVAQSAQQTQVQIAGIAGDVTKASITAQTELGKAALSTNLAIATANQQEQIALSQNALSAVQAQSAATQAAAAAQTESAKAEQARQDSIHYYIWQTGLSPNYVDMNALSQIGGKI